MPVGRVNAEAFQMQAAPVKSQRVETVRQV